MKLADWLARAQEEGFALGAFNISNLEMFKAVVQAAVAQKSPVIIESSDGETAFAGADNLVSLVATARHATGLPIFLNLDHSRTPEKVQIGLDAGYDLVHYDGSKEDPTTNLHNLRSIVPAAHRKGILVEGERDYIIEGSEVRTISAAEGRAHSHLTDPDEARAFVREAGIDIFAVSIGNVHGLYTTPKQLDFDLLARIREAVSSYLSLHGGSGISADQIRRGIETGRFVKINVATELRQALRTGLEEAFTADPDQVAIYKLAPTAIAKVQAIVEAKLQLFGSAGKAVSAGS